MRKGIVATILIYSLVQIVCVLASVLSSKFTLLSFSDIGIDALIKLSISAIIGFIFLGFHLNRKYNQEVNFKRFIVVGFFIKNL